MKEIFSLFSRTKIIYYTFETKNTEGRRSVDGVRMKERENTGGCAFRLRVAI